jgi:hypothetical protein
MKKFIIALFVSVIAILATRGYEAMNKNWHETYYNSTAFKHHGHIVHVGDADFVPLSERDREWECRHGHSFTTNQQGLVHDYVCSFEGDAEDRFNKDVW